MVTYSSQKRARRNCGSKLHEYIFPIRTRSENYANHCFLLTSFVLYFLFFLNGHKPHDYLTLKCLFLFSFICLWTLFQVLVHCCVLACWNSCQLLLYYSSLLRWFRLLCCVGCFSSLCVLKLYELPKEAEGFWSWNNDHHEFLLLHN